MMNVTKLNITQFVKDNTTFITNECFDWCSSNIPDGCTVISPYYYVSLFFVMLGMGLGMSEKLKILSYLCYSFALIVFLIVWGGFL